MRGSMSLGSHDLEAADARHGECPSWLTTVELASIICTGSTSVMWALSAAERRKVQWKGVPVQRKDLPVQRKASRSAAESWSSQKSSLANGLFSIAYRIGAFLAVSLLVSLDHEPTNLLGVIREHQQADIFLADLVSGQHGITNPVNQPAPELRIIENDGEVAHFLRLDERQRFKQFIHRAEAAGEDHERLRVFNEHGLAHEKVAEVERDIQVAIRSLLEGQLDVTANRDIVTLLRPLIASLHDARAAARDNAKARLRQQTSRLYRSCIGGIIGLCAR